MQSLHELQKYRQDVVSSIPMEGGAYSICDLNGEPMYIGKSTENGKGWGMRRRLQTHLCSVNSNVMAMRQLDLWEVAYVKTYHADCSDKELESWVYWNCPDPRTLVNNTKPPRPLETVDPEVRRYQVLPEDVRRERKEPRLRYSRQLLQLLSFLDALLFINDNGKSRHVLEAHYLRTARRHEEFQLFGNCEETPLFRTLV